MSQEQRWRSRPVVGAVLRFAIFAIPIALSVVAATVTARLLPYHDELWSRVMWWGAVLSVSVLVLIAGEAVARRLLPLVALLRLSLLFPGPAPSRIAVTRQSTKRELRRLVEHVKEEGLDEDPAVAARTIVTLAAALNTHDRPTRGHSERVRAVTDLLAERLDLAESDRDRLRWAALLHDVGKLLVPHGVLNKVGRLSDDEWEIIRSHPEAGDRLVAPMRGWLGDWGSVIREHHERWDGSGYPAGLRAEDISWGARIVAVADSYEVMTAARSYQGRPRTPAAAREELVRCAGRQFDPAVVRAFLNLSTRRLWLLVGPLAWLAQVPMVSGIPNAAGQAPQVAAASVAAVKVGTAVGAIVLVDRNIGTVTSGDEDAPQAAPAAPGGNDHPTSPATTPPAPDTDVTTAVGPDDEGEAALGTEGVGDPPEEQATTGVEGVAGEDATGGPAPPGGTGSDVGDAPPEAPVPGTAAGADPAAEGEAPDDPGSTTGSAAVPPGQGAAAPPSTSPPGAAGREVTPTTGPAATVPATRTGQPDPGGGQPPPGVTAPGRDGAPPDPQPLRIEVRPGERVLVDVVAAEPAGVDADTLAVVEPPERGTALVRDAAVQYDAPTRSGADRLTYELCDTAAACRTRVLLIVVAPRG